jgi:hypothetical protein
MVSQIFMRLSWELAEEHAKMIASSAIRCSNFDWLRDGGLETLITSHIENEGLKINRAGKARLRKLAAHQCSMRLLRKLAKLQSLELIGLRCKTPGQFMVHDYMNPWVLMQEHADHIRHPLKDWEFWYSRPHRLWVDAMIELDTLVPDMLNRFNEEYKDWTNQGLIKCVASREEFPRAAVFSVGVAI